MSYKKFVNKVSLPKAHMGLSNDKEQTAFDAVYSKYKNYLPVVYQGPDNRLERYSIYDGMEQDPIISAALDVQAEYVTQTNRIFSGNDNIGVLVMKYITQNYAAKITLPILAEKFSCSQSLLVKSFKKEYNSTIMGELMRIRLEKAANYLKNSRLSIKEIATKCGFSEQNYFSKSFSEKYGCSPIKYRNTSCE
jgi:AraC-like DNA-binding protein